MQHPGKVLKAEKWWNDKATPVLGVAYLLLAQGNPPAPLPRALTAMAAFVAAFIGVAGYGHVVNDLCDIEVDRSAGKSNSMQHKTATQVAQLLVLLLLCSALPWLVLPASVLNLSALAFQLLLLTLYACPPVRLKDRPIAGVIADALYAYTVPFLITWPTWIDLSSGTAPRPYLFAALLAWSVFAGFKGILNHQYQDAKNDERCGLRTFATRYGRPVTLRILVIVVIPLEALSFGLLTAALSRLYPWYFSGIVLYCLWRIFQLRYLWNEQFDLPWRMPPEQVVAFYGYRLLQDFCTGWFPVFMLIALCLRDPSYLLLAGVHIAVFDTGIVHVARYELRYVPGAFARMLRREHV